MSSKRSYNPPVPGCDPPILYPPYASTVKRAPRLAPIRLEQTLSEITGPLHAGRDQLFETGMDLTRQVRGGEAQGQRIIVHGLVLDAAGRPQPGMLVEVWQANAAGRYRHQVDQHDAPLDRYFVGNGRALTDRQGRYRFVTIEPGAYPWGNHYNAWRPKHIHFSLFGPALATRLVTQMYFPGDPLLSLDPIFNSVPDRDARYRLVATLDMENGIAGEALCYRFDIVLRGRHETPMETDGA